MLLSFKASKLHPGLFEQGPLEKFGLFGLVLGFSIDFIDILLFFITYHVFFYIYFLEIKMSN